jgi:hypothetical protein
MANTADQNARLQVAIDALPTTIYATSASTAASILADSIRASYAVLAPGKSDSVLEGACSDLEQTGLTLESQGGTTSADHPDLGVYVRPDDGWTSFTRSYAAAWRRLDALGAAEEKNATSGIWWKTITDPQTWAKAVGDTASELKQGGKDLFSGVFNLTSVVVAGIIAVMVIVIVMKIAAVKS